MFWLDDPWTRIWYVAIRKEKESFICPKTHFITRCRGKFPMLEILPFLDNEHKTTRLANHNLVQFFFPPLKFSDTDSLHASRWPWCWERLRAGGKGTIEDEMVGWNHWLNGQGFGWTLGVGDGQGGLACCGSWGLKESDTTERLKWTERTAEGSLTWLRERRGLA